MYNKTEETRPITDRKDMLLNSFAWSKITTDIEKFYTLKNYIVDSFRDILERSPAHIHPIIQEKIDKLEGHDYIFNLEEFTDFLRLAQINSATLMSSLDHRRIDDYAVPWKTVEILDKNLRNSIEAKYTKNNFDVLASEFARKLYELRILLGEIDWKKGWY